MTTVRPIGAACGWEFQPTILLPPAAVNDVRTKPEIAHLPLATRITQAERIKSRAKGEGKDTNKDFSNNNSEPSTMKSAFLTAISLLAAAVHCIVVEPESRATDGYVQLPSGTASFTFYSGCDRPGKHRELHST